jgi:mRNA interferase RelE/StbE
VRKLALSKPVVTTINELQAKQFKQVMGKILSLLNDPTPPDSQQLKGFNDCRRTDMGEFRIVYRFDETTIVVSLVGKRNDDEIYRRLKNLP